MGHRHTARLRLTLWYGGLVFATGAALLVLNYLLVERSLTADRAELAAAVERQVAREVVEEPGDTAYFRGFLPGMENLEGEAFSTAQQSLLQEVLERLLARSLVALGVTTVFSLGVGWLMAGRALRPLKDITSTARRLSEENLHERIRLRGPDDELKELADTFDAMLERLEAAFHAQRDFVANASHELRTPLAIIRTELDVTLADPGATPGELRAMGEAIRTATARSERLVDSLLTLARTEGEPDRNPVDLTGLVRSLMQEVRPAAAERGVTVATRLDDAVVAGETGLLERLVANLLDNAVRHNLSEGRVDVACGRRGTTVVLQVANSGPVLDETQVATLFQRFRRLDPSRTRATGGFGLGLSIVKAVTHAHGGRVRAHALPQGGLSVTVELPAAESRAEADVITESQVYSA